MRRISVVGTSGSGKTTVARRIAARLGLPHVELDSIYHQPGWTTLPTEEFVARVDALTDADGWVVDGNYREVSDEGPVWVKADTIVWLDVSDARLMQQVVGRTFRRWITREELWNGNREPLSGPFRWDPEQSIIRWAWTRRRPTRERYDAAFTDPTRSHQLLVRLRTRAEIEAWIERLPGATA
jgi:adenylate kinase family enzyme